MSPKLARFILRSRSVLRRIAGVGSDHRARFALRNALRLTRGDTYFYQPVSIGTRTYPAKRHTESRWEAISGEIRSFGIRSILDIGCAEAWLLRRAAAAHGCFGLGVEADSRRVRAGEIARLHDDVSRFAVMRAELDSEGVRGLPVCEMVLCLSLLHHIIRKEGLEEGRAFLRSAVSRASKAVVFEMGTAEEGGMGWAGDMPDMPEGQFTFLKRFLESAGLTNVRAIARTPGFAGDAERILCIGEPSTARDRGEQPSVGKPHE